MEKKNCVIWGIGNIGSSPILKNMISKRYNVITYLTIMPIIGRKLIT